MIETLEARALNVLEQGRGRRAPISLLLADDAFCTLMTAHRLAQGVGFPDPSPTLPASARLAFLHALAAGEDVAEAREGCDRRRTLLERMAVFRALPDGSIRDMLMDSIVALFDDPSPSSHWAAQHLLYGSDRIPQSAIPLHEKDTSPEEAVRVVCNLMRRPPDRRMTISDINTLTEAIGFIRIGEAPAHFGFPETASPKTGTNAAILHYEIDHPGGEFLFFTRIGGPLSETMERIQEDCPLYINDMHQLMALNSYHLQEMGAFCVPCGNTKITFIDRDGVISASEYPDFKPDAQRILAELRLRGIEDADLAGLAVFLGGEKLPAGRDHDWDMIERVSLAHPDLMGHLGMDVERSQIFGISREGLLAFARRACDGDEAAALEAVEAAREGAAVLDLPAGRLHLHVPNLASRSRLDDAVPLLNAVTGRNDGALMFLLSDRALDFGTDPHAVATMRRLPAAEPDPDLAPL
jgi:hypothetical protein